MPYATPQSSSLAPGPANFALTRWSVVVAAGRRESTQARAALEQLCRTYWPPIYAFVRQQGHSPPDAQDLTQEFFVRLLEKNYLADVDRSKGRFRSFLLAAVKHFLANARDRARAQKRGGDQVFIPISGPAAETGYCVEPVDQVTPEKLFERRWALTLLDTVLARLRSEYQREGKGALFAQLKTTLTGERRAIGYADLAARTHASEGALKVAVHRLRQRYRALLREEIAHTVSRPEEIEEELGALFAALGS